MKLLLWLVLLASGVFGAEVRHQKAPAKLAVAIRYLIPKGVSHSHVYLYREDGKLLRQLTKDDSGQDRDPFFSPDGTAIVFTRDLKKALEFWSVDPLGGNLRKLDEVPEWYANAKNAPCFGPRVVNPITDESAPPQKLTTPDGAKEIILRTEDEDFKGDDGQGRGRHFILRDVRSGRRWEMGKFPGFFGLAWPITLDTDPKFIFLIHPTCRIAFFDLHLNSGQGETIFAVDLNARRVVRLSPNWATPFPLPGEPAFITFTYVRYLPIPGTKMTADCSYLDRWDATLKKVRYADEGSAAILYGGSIYRPGREPATIYIQKDPD